jgi:SAM-dependent methyltransferase
MKVNSREYWNQRFESDDWIANNGRIQTRDFAKAQAKLLPLKRNFRGSFLDFGCAMGDSLPIFKAAWPGAIFRGMDMSQSAIEIARSDYRGIAQFFVGEHESCPESDVILTSNVLEHVSDDHKIIDALLRKCRRLFIVVPFEEQYLIPEHVRRYGVHSFARYDVVWKKIFPCKGWSQFGLSNHWWEIEVKNVLRPFFGRIKLKRRMQIAVELKGKLT